MQTVSTHSFWLVPCYDDIMFNVCPNVWLVVSHVMWRLSMNTCSRSETYMCVCVCVEEKLNGWSHTHSVSLSLCHLHCLSSVSPSILINLHFLLLSLNTGLPGVCRSNLTSSLWHVTMTPADHWSTDTFTVHSVRFILMSLFQHAHSFTYIHIYSLTHSGPH